MFRVVFIFGSQRNDSRVDQNKRVRGAKNTLAGNGRVETEPHTSTALGGPLTSHSGSARALLCCAQETRPHMHDTALPTDACSFPVPDEKGRSKDRENVPEQSIHGRGGLYNPRRQIWLQLGKKQSDTSSLATEICSQSTVLSTKNEIRIVQKRRRILYMSIRKMYIILGSGRSFLNDSKARYQRNRGRQI